MEERQHFRSFYELSQASREAKSDSAMSDSSMDMENEETHARVVRETWAEIQDRLPELGRIVYQKVVEKNIELASLFQDTSFANQHVAFMTMMGQSIEWLSDISVWHRRMTPLAQRHVKYGVKPQHYKHFRTAFLKALRQFLDPYDEEREDAWYWYWGKIMDTLGYATQSNLQNSSLAPVQYATYVRTVHECWMIVSEDPAEFGSTFYANLVEADEGMRDLFASSDLSRQSVRFFGMFNHAIRQMDDAAGFENAIIALTFKHKQYGVELHHVDAFGLSLKATLRSTIGDRWTDEMSTAWDWFWNRIHACFEYGLAHSHEHEAVAEAQSNDQASESSALDADLVNARIFKPIISLQSRRA